MKPRDRVHSIKRRHLRTIDGDTVECSIKCKPRLFDKILLRLDGLDAPETKGESNYERELAAEATAKLDRLIKKARRIQISNVRWGKWGGRTLAIMHIDGENVADVMIEEGLARPYSGGKRGPWTKPRRKRKSKKGWSRRQVFVVTSVLLAVAVMIWDNY